MNDSNDHPDTGKRRGLSPLQVFGSALASAFGVQSSRNRKRDFSQGKAAHFIVAGFLFVMLFVLVMVCIVNFVVGTTT